MPNYICLQCGVQFAASDHPRSAYLWLTKHRGGLVLTGAATLAITLALATRRS